MNYNKEAQLKQYDTYHTLCTCWIIHPYPIATIMSVEVFASEPVKSWPTHDICLKLISSMTNSTFTREIRGAEGCGIRVAGCWWLIYYISWSRKREAKRAGCCEYTRVGSCNIQVEARWLYFGWWILALEVGRIAVFYGAVDRWATASAAQLVLMFAV